MGRFELPQWLGSAFLGASSEGRTTKKLKGRRGRRRLFVCCSELLESRAMLSATLGLGGVAGINSYAGVGIQENLVADFYASLNSQPDTNKSHFTATIQWGDGSSSSGDLVLINSAGAQAQYQVKGSHIYNQTSTGFNVTVSVTGDGKTVSGVECHVAVTTMPSGIAGIPPPSATTTDPPSNVQVELGGVNGFNSYANVGFQENVVGMLYATLNGEADTNIDDLHAEINWGDSDSWTSADLVFVSAAGSQAEYLVKGTHIYSSTTTGIPVVIYATGPDGTSISGMECRPTVLAMPSGLPGTPPPGPSGSAAPEDVKLGLGGVGGINAQAGVELHNVLVGQLYGSLNDEADGNVGDLHVQINWGDSSSWTSANLVLVSGEGPQAQYDVYGSHTYGSASDNDPIVIYANGPDGTSISGQTDTAVVAASPSLTLGDLVPTQWTQNQSNYNGTIDVGGGTDGYQNLQVTGLPDGLTASIESTSGTVNGKTVQSGTITISGTPTESGTFSLQVSVEDGTGDSMGSGDYTLFIAPALALGDLAPTQWVANEPNYDGEIDVTGGSDGYQNLQVTGLPTGLSFNLEATSGTIQGATTQSGTIEITGAPTEVGTFTIDVSIEDGDGDQTSGTYTLNIEAPLALGDLTPARWTLNQSNYNGLISVTGGSGTLSFEQVSGLPTGLSDAISPGGNGIAIIGTPTEGGVFTLGVFVEDADGQQTGGDETLTIDPNGLLLGPLNPTQWTVNKTGYSGDIAITGGSGSYSHLSVSGLPTGLTAKVSGHSIVVSGTPKQQGTFSNIQIAVEDSKGEQGMETVSLTIDPAITIGIVSPADWDVNQPGYDGTISVSGGTGSYKNLKITGLPPGLSASILSSVITVGGVQQLNGEIDITGTPTKTGDYTLNVSLQDSLGAGVSAIVPGGVVSNAVSLSAHGLAAVDTPNASPLATTEKPTEKITINPANVDLTASVDGSEVVPTAATDLNLYFFWGNEKVNVPVTIQNLGPDVANGAVKVSLSLVQAAASVPKPISLGSFTTTLKNLASSATTTITKQVTIPTSPVAGQSYYIMATVTSATSALVDSDPNNNSGSTAKTFEFVGTPKSNPAVFSGTTFLNFMRYVLQGVEPPNIPDRDAFSQINVAGFIAGFEGEVPYPYKVAGKGNTTIGIGMEIPTLQSHGLLDELKTDVQNYQDANDVSGWDNLTDSAFVSKLNTLANQKTTTPIMYQSDEVTLFDELLQPFENTAESILTAHNIIPNGYQDVALIDIQYNTAGGLNSFPSMLTALSQGDLLRAVFQLCDAQRTTQAAGLTTRTAAEVVNMLQGLSSVVGQIVS